MLFYLQPQNCRFLLAAEKRPNLLFIMCDQYRQDAMGAYGNTIIKTPNLDRLAKEGMRFNYFYVAGFPCSPSRAVFLTGLYPHTNGMITNDLILNPQLPTMGTVLKDAGYDNMWIGKWHLAASDRLILDEKGKPIKKEKDSPQNYTNPSKVGFDNYVAGGQDYKEYLEKSGFGEIIKGKRIGGDSTIMQDGHSLIPEEHFITTYYANNAVEFLKEKAKTQQPFCLCVSINGPHRPVDPPEPWDKMYPLDQIKLPANFYDDMKNKPRIQKDFAWRMLGKKLDENERKRVKNRIAYENEMWDLFDRPEWTEKEFKEWISHYYGFISSIDKQIGRILDTLDSLGLKNNTVVVFTSDHGDLTGSHGMIDKNMAMHEELMKVPFIIRYPPAIKPGSASNALISNVDFLPTILDLMRLHRPDGLQGKSFLGILGSKTDKHRDAVFTTFPALGIQARMIRTENWKYSLNWKPRDIDELYDEKNDPGELRNLIYEPKYKSKIEELKKQIFKWMEETKDPWLEDAKEAAKTEYFKANKIDFEFNEAKEAVCWTVYGGLRELKVQDGKLLGEITTPGYMICELAAPVKGDDYPALSARMKATAGTVAQLYWITTDSPSWDEKKSIIFPIKGDGEFHAYLIETGKNDNWAGKQVTGIRLNPVRDKNINAKIEIDWIRQGKM